MHNTRVYPILTNAHQTQLFIPQVLRHHLQQSNEKSALFLAHRYSRLEYFAHALEVLLHDVLDAEVDGGGGGGGADPQATATRPSLLPAAVALLAAFPPFLDVVVQCTRKTDVRSWRTLFDHLPPARRLFEHALEQGRLKTAAGYLLVLHNLDERGAVDGAGAGTGGEQEDGELVSRLLRRAADVEDWELCKELARFLVALDKSGETLRRALRVVGLVAGDGESGEEDEVEEDANGVVE
jgi:RAB6A-GEF complex partner protein 1